MVAIARPMGCPSHVSITVWSRRARGQKKCVRLYAARASPPSRTGGGFPQPSVEPAVVSHPRRGNFGKRRVACVEPEKARGLLTGWSRTAGLSSGRWRSSPTTLSQPGRRGGRLPRHGDRRLGPHSSASPAGQPQKPGCAWLRGVPCSAAFCTLVCCKSARLLDTWPTNPLPSTNKYYLINFGEL